MTNQPQPQQQFEGETIEDALAAAAAKLGAGLEVLDAQRVRRGGLGGFFSKEHYIVTATANAVPASRTPNSGAQTGADDLLSAPLIPQRPTAVGQRGGTATLERPATTGPLLDQALDTPHGQSVAPIATDLTPETTTSMSNTVLDSVLNSLIDQVNLDEPKTADSVPAPTSASAPERTLSEMPEILVAGSSTRSTSNRSPANGSPSNASAAASEPYDFDEHRSLPGVDLRGQKTGGEALADLLSRVTGEAALKADAGELLSSSHAAAVRRPTPPRSAPVVEQFEPAPMSGVPVSAAAPIETPVTDPSNLPGGPAWSRHGLEQMGLPAAILHRLPLEASDLEWTNALERAIASIVPLPTDAANAHARTVINGFGRTAAVDLVCAGVSGFTPGRIEIDGQCVSATATELALAIRSLLPR